MKIIVIASSRGVACGVRYHATDTNARQIHENQSLNSNDNLPAATNGVLQWVLDMR